MESECKGHQDDVLKIVALFFADNGLFLAKTVEEAEKTIDNWIKVGEECCLNIDKAKSNTLIFNMKDKPEKTGRHAGDKGN